MIRTLLISLACVAVASADDKKPEAKALFDGKSLTGWQSSFRENSGKVEVKDGAILLPKGMKMTGITYAGKDFPKTDYEVTLEGKRVDGGDFFCTTTFPVGDDFCSLVVGGWGGKLTGISSINGADASENETTSSFEFKNDTWYAVRIRVSPAKVTAWIGDEQVVDVARKQKKFSTRLECEDCQPFGVATYDTAAAVRNIQLRGLTETEKKAK